MAALLRVKSRYSSPSKNKKKMKKKNSNNNKYPDMRSVPGQKAAIFTYKGSLGSQQSKSYSDVAHLFFLINFVRAFKQSIGTKAH